jgi:tetratricopeptide (TPR) repeat protein
MRQPILDRRWGRIATSALIAGTVLAGCAPKQPQPKEQQLVGVDLYVRGEQAYRKGDKDQALRDYLAAVEKNPNLRIAQARVAEIYRQRGQYEKALPHDQAVSRLDPYSFLSHYNLGLTYHLLNRLQEAAASYLQALDLKPSDMKSNMNLGLVYLALGKSDDSVKYLQRATELDPNSAVAWSNLGVALDARGDSARAESIYRKSLELDSASATALQNLAANLLAQGKAKEAIAVMEQVMPRVDTAGTHKRYGDALAMDARYDDAIREYDAAIKRDPRFYPAINEKAFTLMRQYRDSLELDDGKRRTAIDLWRQSLKVNPNQPAVRDQIEKTQNSRLFGK